MRFSGFFFIFLVLIFVIFFFLNTIKFYYIRRNFSEGIFYLFCYPFYLFHGLLYFFFFKYYTYLNVKSLKWFPLFKRTSYYGFFISNREFWLKENKINKF